MTDTRAYTYNPANLQHLFAKIVEWLSEPGGEEDSTGRILVEVCNHFHFGSGFIYEADHTNTFRLKERHSDYAECVKTAFRMEEHLDSDEMGGLLDSRFYYLHHVNDGGNPPRIAGLFPSNTILMVPVLHQDNRIVGLVGMMDRRRNILLDDQAVHAAKMVLNLLANNVKIRTYQRNLEYARETLSSIFNNIGVSIYAVDFDTYEILYVNKPMAEPYGGVEYMLGKECWRTLYNDKTGPCEYCPKVNLIDQDGKPVKIYQWDYQRPFDGSWFRVLSAAFRWVDGRLAHVISSIDITENKLNEATIARMANYDALTTLPNRRKLLSDCEDALKEAAENHGGGSLLFFDLDSFKRLNDSVGHQAGDELLQRIGTALQEHPLTKDHAYRYGGDEFVLLYRDADGLSVEGVVEFILRRFSQPWILSSAAWKCGASIGIAKYPADAAAAEELLHKADMLMYKAKQSGGGIACASDGTTIQCDAAR